VRLDDPPVGQEIVRHGSERIRYRTVLPADLCAGQATELFGSMREVARAATVDSSGSTWVDADWDGRFGQFMESRCHLACSPVGLIGFMWTRRLRVEGWRVVHLQAAYVLPEHHGRGIGFAMNARMVLREAPLLLRGRSLMLADMASPVALHGWRSRARCAADFFPLIDGRGLPRPSPLLDIAGSLAVSVYPGLDFDSRTGVLRSKTHPRGTPMSFSGEDAVDRYFEDFVHGAAGDTALVVMRPRAWEFIANAGQLVRAVPRALRRRPSRRRPPVSPSSLEATR
jgi:GNAT superfamily N-acetyltransferase